MPLLSLITACYNNESTLKETIDSVRIQKDVDLEYIIIDGASNDNGLNIIRNSREIVSSWISEPDDGIYHALNKGLGIATGEIVGFLHADDILANGSVLSRIVNCFEDPSVDACYGDLIYVSKYNTRKRIRNWKSGSFDYELLKSGWMPPHPTLYVRRQLYEEVGGFDTGYKIASDYDCMLRLFTSMQGKVVYIPEVLVHMRLGGVSNRSFSNILRKSWEDYTILRENGIGGFGALTRKNLSKLRQFFS